VEELARRGIALEVCVTSNVWTGAVARLEEHPLRRLFDAGVPVVLNSDDPALFRTSVCEEYALAADAFGFAREELARVAENGFRHALRPTGR